MYFLLCSAGSSQESDLEGKLGWSSSTIPCVLWGMGLFTATAYNRKLSVVLGPGGLTATASLPRAGGLFHSGTLGTKGWDQLRLGTKNSSDIGQVSTVHPVLSGIYRMRRLSWLLLSYHSLVISGWRVGHCHTRLVHHWTIGLWSSLYLQQQVPNR